MANDRAPSLPLVIASSAAGTVIEWYDFYIFGTLTVFLTPHFFPKENPTAGLLSTLAVFASGFAARPFGALVFGRIGDLVGRKYAFLLTLLIMGASTFAIGLLPTYAQVGILAPALLTALRLIQGLALGGEYGGAAIYVAEHAPEGQRGLFTSFIQTTATIGLFAALGVILLTRQSLGDDAFRAWGWRVPFLLSAFLMGLSVYIRVRLKESPLFTAMRESGKTSKAPLTESFGNARNWRVIAVAFFGAAAGQAAIWYTGQFYALLFLQTILKVDYAIAYQIVAMGLLLGTPFFIVFGALSDRIGRKPIMMAGNLLAVLTVYPIFRLMTALAPAGAPNIVGLTLCVAALVILVTMVYAPIAAYLVEAFPARIRYTSLSLPYHVANGYIGGFTPLIATALVARTGNNYAGLWWPIGIAAMTFVVGMVALRDTRGLNLWQEAVGRDGP
ncbi:MAG: MHS family MFS transporter [Gemmatimonadaceae bacterium]|nr:MHS family MFS transporter [Gemmatimonadaceae bacterium]